MKATEQYFDEVLFVVLTFESVNEILTCDHSNQSYSVVLAYGAVYYAVKDCYNLRVCERNPCAYHFNIFKIGQFSLIPRIIIPFEEVINCKLRCR